MFCKYCGSKIEDGKTVCEKCGKPQDETGLKIPKETRINRKFILFIIFIGILLLALAIRVVSNEKTAYYIKTTTVEAGSTVDTKMLVLPKSPDADISIHGIIDTKKIGEYRVNCVVTNGFFKREDPLRITVEDTSKPVIVGPHKISLVLGEVFEPSDYYSVDDFEEGLEKNINVIPAVDITKGGTQEITLSVADSSGNVGTRSIVVEVLKLSKNEKVVHQAIKKYLADGYAKRNILSKAWIMKASGAQNGVEYYVEVASNVLYAIYQSGKISEYTVHDAGDDLVFGMMVYAVHYNGTTIDTSKLLN